MKLASIHEIAIMASGVALATADEVTHFAPDKSGLQYDDSVCFSH